MGIVSGQAHRKKFHGEGDEIKYNIFYLVQSIGNHFYRKFGGELHKFLSIDLLSLETNELQKMKNKITILEYGTDQTGRN